MGQDNKITLKLLLVYLIVKSLVYPNKPDFVQYLKQNTKHYSSPSEKEYRQMIFNANSKVIQAHNKDPKATFKKGYNQFTDWTQQEFEEIILNSEPPSNFPLTRISSIGSSSAGIPSTTEMFVDWVAKGVVSPVKDQDICGSCWAFAVLGALESTYMIQYGVKYDFSEQQLVDCSFSYGNDGCNGGWPKYALDYIWTNRVSLENSYPYVGRVQNCQHRFSLYSLSGYVTVQGCTNLKYQILNRPIVVAVDGSRWMSYQSGLFNDCKVNNIVNHAVLLVGIDMDQNWRIQNSWATTWGQAGYMTLLAGNSCNICLYPGYYAYL